MFVVSLEKNRITPVTLFVIWISHSSTMSFFTLGQFYCIISLVAFSIICSMNPSEAYQKNITHNKNERQQEGQTTHHGFLSTPLRPKQKGTQCRTCPVNHCTAFGTI